MNDISRAGLNGVRTDGRDVGLFDICMHGWFANDTGCVYPGMPITSEDVVADIGCGDGGIALFCARQGAHIILSDLDTERLDGARRRLEDVAPGRVEARSGNGQALPIEDARVTRTICTEVVEHVDDPDALVRELFRITRPGGLLLIACPHPASERVQKHIAPPVYFQHPNHIRIVSEDAFAGYVTGAGFTIERRDTYGFYSAIRWSLFWRCGIDAADSHPMLEAWAATWRQLLEAEGGRDVQRALDDALPKSQVIIARRPLHATAPPHPAPTSAPPVDPPAQRPESRETGAPGTGPRPSLLHRLAARLGL